MVDLVCYYPDYPIHPVKIKIKRKGAEAQRREERENKTLLDFLLRDENPTSENPYHLELQPIIK